MTIHHAFTNLFYIFCFFPTFFNPYIFIYHTQNSPSVQYYDWIYFTQSKIQDNIQGVKYCRHLNETQPFQRNFNQSCHNSGQLWAFEELSTLNVSAKDVLQWSSSLEQTDRYKKYLSNNSFQIEDNYLCNCTNPSTFGKFCQYQFYDQSISFH